VRSRHDSRLPCRLHPATIVCNCQPTPAVNQFRSPVCASVKDSRRGPIFCSCWSTLVEQSAYLYHIEGSLAIFKKHSKTFLFRTAYDWQGLLTFSVNSVKPLRSDLSLTPLYKLTYYIQTCDSDIKLDETSLRSIPSQAGIYYVVFTLTQKGERKHKCHCYTDQYNHNGITIMACNTEMLRLKIRPRGSQLHKLRSQRFPILKESSHTKLPPLYLVILCSMRFISNDYTKVW